MTCAIQQVSPATEMTTLSRTLYAALVAGAAAGVLLFVLQSWTTLPLIHQAERYEIAQAPVHPHSHANEPSDNQLVRAAYTTTGDILVGIGFAMLLAAMYALSGKSGLGQGLLWGLAGFATFHLGPALVVPPSISRTGTGSLVDPTGCMVARHIHHRSGACCLRVRTESREGSRPPAFVSAERDLSLCIFRVRR